MAERGRAAIREDDAIPVAHRTTFTSDGVEMLRAPILPQIEPSDLAYDRSPGSGKLMPRKLNGGDYQSKETLTKELGEGMIARLPNKGRYAVVDVTSLDSYPYRMTINARFYGSIGGYEIRDLIDLHELSTALVYGHETMMNDGQVTHCLIIPRIDDHYIILKFGNRLSEEGDEIPAAYHMATELSMLRERLRLLSPERTEIIRKRTEQKMKVKNQVDAQVGPEVILNREIAHFTQVLTDAGIPPDRDQWTATKRHKPEASIIPKAVKDMTPKEVEMELRRQIERAAQSTKNEALQQAVAEYTGTKLQVPWTKNPEDTWWTFANLGSLFSCGTVLLTTPIAPDVWSIAFACVEGAGVGFAGLFLAAQLIDYLDRRSKRADETKRLALRKIRLSQDPVNMRSREDEIPPVGQIQEQSTPHTDESQPVPVRVEGTGKPKDLWGGIIGS